MIVPAARELDLATCPTLADQLDEIPAEAAVIVDLGGVDFCDSTGVAVLLNARERQVLGGGTLRIRGASRHVELALTIMGVYDLLATAD